MAVLLQAAKNERINKMQPTNIRWVRSPDGSRGFSWNPIRGLCKINCSYCYAKAIYKRFKLNSEVRFDTKELYTPYHRKKPAGIFCSSTHELFGEWIPEEWRTLIFNHIKISPQHRFYILTKRPRNIHMDEMPPNVWLGATITGEEREEEQVIRLRQLMNVKAGIHFVSFEPLLGPIAEKVLRHIADGQLDWVIVGARTQPLKSPKMEWIDNIFYHTSYLCKHTPLFAKNNLGKLIPAIKEYQEWATKDGLIQEFPKSE